MQCPICGARGVTKDAKEVHRQDMIYLDPPVIMIIYHCRSCNRDPAMIFEMTEWVDEDDNPIEPCD